MSETEEREPFSFVNQGQKIYGMIHRPLKKEHVPAVVILHGFAGTKIGKYRIYVKVAQKLAENGILAVRFDFRGSGDSEGDISEMTLEGEVSDAVAALKLISKDPQVDPSRIGILGRSLGGIVSVMACNHFKHIKSLALWAPAFHAKQWMEQLNAAKNPKLSPDEREELMQFDGNKVNENFLKQFFTLNLDHEMKHLDSMPLLHIHGEKDHFVDISHADDYYRVRLKAKGETVMLRLPNTDHEFSHAKDQAHAIDETVSFFKRTL